MTDNELEVGRRDLELEEYLKNNYPYGQELDEVVASIYRNFGITFTAEYLINAYIMPKEEIEEVIKYIDKNATKITAEDLIEQLSIKYSVERKSMIVKRIKEVRRMNKVEKAANKGKKRKKVAKMVV